MKIGQPIKKLSHFDDMWLILWEREFVSKYGDKFSWQDCHDNVNELIVLYSVKKKPQKVGFWCS
jgi:hypothetical protein